MSLHINNHFLSVLISPNAFKGTLKPTQAARLIAKVIQKRHPHLKTIQIPLADGGDGTLDVLAKALRARIMTTAVNGPLGRRVTAKWGIAGKGNSKLAIIEMAQASGLALLNGRNQIMKASSFGTGQLIQAALNKGCRTIFLGVGGTATADGGAGALAALGLQYRGERGRRLGPNPSELIHLKKVDWSQFDRRIRKTKIYVLCDVKNPLLGPHGSAVTFSPQKGATKKQVQILEKIMHLWSTHAKRKRKNQPGDGAAGALAFGLSAFAGAKLVEGAPFIMKIIQWKKSARKAQWIVTGEGKLDLTSFSGKVVGTIAKALPRKKIVVICGSMHMKISELKRFGIHKVILMGSFGRQKPVKALERAAHQLADSLSTEHS